ncbi:DNA helicase UvrD [Bradyrhizobium sp. MOS001]|uniref:UvrD-helicase domain-containing protein n=1 Tax=Bradyrhizobium sp. MOS001 TaxID=2133948 RepID=UPI0010752EE3|nr:UvrD-helicase domain-containing protein [Bradyrhizobium sp. MOS001]TFW57610.1 DNA helicase UvrD [Bradyrhizobium sp. MOS001]
MTAEVDLFAIRRGSVTAPAGCGKTHLIATSLLRHEDKKPVLILTHTNAGVIALRTRLTQLGVPTSAYRVLTMDGWAMRLTSTFPTRSGLNPSVLRISNPTTDYPAIRKAAVELVKHGHVDDTLAASFSRLLVDEYQDCTMSQHALAYYSSRALPTCVLGDPLQTVFNFNEKMPEWDGHVCKYFPPSGELSVPWRWKNAGTEVLGRWLLDVRAQLAAGESIDLSKAPKHVTWVHLDGTEDHERRLRAARTTAPDDNGRVLIIGDSKSPPSQRRFASQTPGAVTVESVDLKDFVQFAEKFDLNAPDALSQLVGFAEDVMTNVGGADMISRLATITAGRAKKPPNEVEQAAIEFQVNRSYSNAAALLSELSKRPGVRSHRPLVLGACIRALNEADSASLTSLHDAALRAREQNRMGGRSLPKRGVGSTLTLKGLEAEVAVILDVSQMSASHLYVAMTRGSKSLIICSKSKKLHPVART